MIGDFIDDHFGWFVFGFFALLGFGIYALGNEGVRQHDLFMAECLTYRKQYECTAMWRAGDSQAVPVVVPMPMVIR